MSDSGLGCGPAGSGVHGWPLCTGKLIPVVGGSTMVEYTHRVVAGLTFSRMPERRELATGSPEPA